MDLERISSLPTRERREVLRGAWEHYFRRDDQKPPDRDWATWLNKSGRGSGKTKVGSEWVRARVRQGARNITLVGATAADVRGVMVEGPAGILACSPPDERPEYFPSTRTLRWPNGCVATTFSGDKPDQLRGPQADTTWVDELAKFANPRAAWEQIEIGTRLPFPGDHARILCTTTPRPHPLIKEIMADPDTATTTMSTYANRKHLDPMTLRRLERRYKGTRLERQELYGEILEAVDGAIVDLDMIVASRLPKAPDLRRVVVGVDPAATSGADADETGIVVGGTDGSDAYVLADRSLRAGPTEWAAAAVKAYHTFGADCIVAEKNNGGEMVETTIRTVDKQVPIRLVHASRGKHVRFEPVGALYEQGRVHHVGVFGDLETQVCAFTPEGYEGGDSPDRADALVWALTHACRLGQGGSTWDDFYGEAA